jgi:hypothetical protein
VANIDVCTTSSPGPNHEAGWGPAFWTDPAMAKRHRVSPLGVRPVPHQPVNGETRAVSHG